MSCSRAVLLLVVAWAACTGPEALRDASDSAAEGTADGDDSGRDAGGDGPEGLDGGDATDGDVAPGGGPVTVVFEVAELSDERFCDLDGDGVEDNAFADLGSPMAQLFTAFLSTFMQGKIEDSSNPFRLVLHLPWVEDRARPNDPGTIGIIFKADDTDSPPDAADDFSGDESYWAKPSALDACGEPAYFFPSMEIADGAVSGTTPALPIPLGQGFPARDARAEGVLEPGGRTLAVAVCGYGTITALGYISADLTADDLSLLDVLIAGGWVVGMPSVPGITPDVDVDGDGLERVVVDDAGRVESCVDGDSTSIPGADCWADPRIADAISLNIRLQAVSARFAGRRPGWEDQVDGECEEGPPEESLFDPPS